MTELRHEFEVKMEVRPFCKQGTFENTSLGLSCVMPAQREQWCQVDALF